jgi:DNA-binding CsgD family transcriptional regulator
MTTSSGDVVLLGRREECAALDRLTTGEHPGGRVLVLRGEAGVGKSALLEHLGRRAGWRIATAVGAESERELAYSGLHQLCAPLLDLLDRLPVPQREALATVFGRSPGPAPDRLMVGLATLTLLAEAAGRHPLLCLVDDAQWLDRATAEVLEFVGRRLLAEPVALVCAARGDEVLAGLPALEITGLGGPDARTLLLGHVHGPLDAAVCDQIIAESHGNPLALLELPRTWRSADLAGGFGLPGDQAVTGRIERGFARRLNGLPADTRMLVLTAAAEPLGDPVLLHRATTAMGIDMAAAVPAVEAGLLRMNSRVEFAHPLVRSAAYHAAAAGARFRVHRALAEATDAGTAPDRRAWHRARATPGPDDDVAAELERSAGRARSRGGLAAAAAFLTRSAELTANRPARVRRALAAAVANVRAGAFDAAGALLAVLREGPLDPGQQARIDGINAQLAYASSRGREAAPLLLAAARRLEPLDPGLARQYYLDAFSAAHCAGRLSDGAGPAEVARAVRERDRPAAAEPTTGDLLLDAFAALTEAEPTTAKPAAALRRLRAEPEPAREWLWPGCVLALEIWDDETAYALAAEHLRLARDTGALSDLPLALGSLTPVLVFRGELFDAAVLAEESRSVMAATGAAATPYGELTLAAWRGHEPAARDLIEATRRDAARRGEGLGVAVAEYAQAVLGNGLGHYDEAAAAAGRACAYPQELIAGSWALAELVEAAGRAGRTEEAIDGLDRLGAKARAAGTDWALGLLARSQALLTGGEDAEGCYREAIERLTRTRVRAELARAHLVYGEWLRRCGRRARARAELTTAYEMFQAAGMAAFGERARRELLATGSSVRRRTAETRDELTGQEAQVARLARDGLSNPEIGAQLFISARTVEWHLRKVFTKLGISSRRQLRGGFSPW